MKAHKKLHDFLIDNGYFYKKAYVKHFSTNNVFIAIDFSKPYKDKLYIDFLPAVPLVMEDNESWPFYSILPFTVGCGQYLYPNGKLYLEEFPFDFKEKNIYEGLIIENLKK